MSEQYVARGNLHHGGVKDGVNNEVWYEDGDQIDTDLFSEKDLADALQVGAIVPKEVYDALQKAAEARVEAERRQVEAEARLQQLQHVARVGDRGLSDLSDTEVTDKERVEEVTKQLVEGAKQASVADVGVSEPPDPEANKVTTPKVASVRSKADQPAEAKKS